MAKRHRPPAPRRDERQDRQDWVRLARAIIELGLEIVRRALSQ